MFVYFCVFFLSSYVLFAVDLSNCKVKYSMVCNANLKVICRYMQIENYILFQHRQGRVGVCVVVVVSCTLYCVWATHLYQDSFCPSISANMAEEEVAELVVGYDSSMYNTGFSW